ALDQLAVGRGQRFARLDHTPQKRQDTTQGIGNHDEAAHRDRGIAVLPHSLRRCRWRLNFFLILTIPPGHETRPALRRVSGQIMRLRKSRFSKARWAERHGWLGARSIRLIRRKDGPDASIARYIGGWVEWHLDLEKVVTVEKLDSYPACP